MSSKKKIIIIISIVIAAILNVWIFQNIRVENINQSEIALYVEVKSEVSNDFQLYVNDQNNNFLEEYSQKQIYDKVNEVTLLKFVLDSKKPILRLDFGSLPAEIIVSNMYLKMYGEEIAVDLSAQLIPGTAKDIQEIEEQGESGWRIVTIGEDPFVVFSVEYETLMASVSSKIETYSLILNILICLIIDAFVLIALKYIKRLSELPIELYRNRVLIFSLAKNDFKTRFAGSYLGIIWAFIQPMVTVLVYWFVFQVGLRAGKVTDFPFILWLLAGLVPWFFFSEGLNGGTVSLIEYQYLVKKVVFKISILPMVKVISAVFVHVFFVLFVMIVCACYGYTPDLYSLQIIYYIICTFLLVLGITYFTSALAGFFKDLLQIIAIVLQVGMWMTPIMWDASSMVSGTLHTILQLNPIYYIVDGFRDALLNKQWFWDKPLWTIYFWLFVIAAFGIGITVFKKLRVHFADVL